MIANVLRYCNVTNLVSKIRKWSYLAKSLTKEPHLLMDLFLR